MKLSRVLAGIGLCLGLFVALATPASAHNSKLNHGADGAWVTSGHHGLGVDDNECDNHYVHVEYNIVWSSTGNIVWGGVLSDSNGCSAGVGYTETTPHRVHEFRLCEQNEGCTAWKAA